jgi:hypothetical protein
VTDKQRKAHFRLSTTLPSVIHRKPDGEPTGHGIRLSEERKRMIDALILTGATQERIASLTGVSPATVARRQGRRA